MPTSILLVEDSAGIRDALTQILRVEGYRVEGVRNGTEALKRLQSGKRFSVILVDLNMPGMDGATFLQEVKKVPAWSSIPAVLMSADARRDGIPADGFVDKPIDLPKLFSILERFTARRDRNSETAEDADASRAGQ